MDGGAQGEALADDPVLFVVLGVGDERQACAHVVLAAAGRVGEVLHREWMPFDEQPQQRHEQAGVEPGLLGADEPVGQASCQVGGAVGHRDLLGSVIGGLGPVRAHAQHDRSDGSVVKALAAIRMPSAMVR